MKRSILAAMVGFGLVLASAVEAQLTNFPNYAVPSAFGAPASTLAASYGRGLNDWSGKQNAFALTYVRSGIGDRVGVAVGGGIVRTEGLSETESDFTFGGRVGVDILGGATDTQITIQGGVGYFSPVEDVSTTSVPIGVSVQGLQGGDAATVRWWFMPRLQYTRVSILGATGSDTDFGASAGGAITMPSGFGIHAAVDLLAANENIWFGGIGLHYRIG